MQDGTVKSDARVWREGGVAAAHQLHSEIFGSIRLCHLHWPRRNSRLRRHCEAPPPLRRRDWAALRSCDRTLITTPSKEQHHYVWLTLSTHCLLCCFNTMQFQNKKKIKKKL